MRKRIMEAATCELRDKGVKFTMSDLARSLGISKRSLYEHFSSKEEIIGAIIDISLENIRQQCQEIFNSDELALTEKLKRILVVEQKVFVSDEGYGRGTEEIKRFFPGEWLKVEKYAEERWGILESILREGIQKGLFRPVYIPIVKKMLNASFSEMLDYKFLAQNKVSLNQMIEHMADILVFGIVDSNANMTVKRGEN